MIITIMIFAKKDNFFPWQNCSLISFFSFFTLYISICFPSQQLCRNKKMHDLNYKYIKMNTAKIQVSLQILLKSSRSPEDALIYSLYIISTIRFKKYCRFECLNMFNFQRLTRSFKVKVLSSSE